MNIKCIGCPELRREIMKLGQDPYFKTDEKGNLVVYKCPRLPYHTTIGGLMRPGKETLKAVADCPVDITGRCAVCSGETTITLGDPDNPIAYICPGHYHAWGDWLDAHPERRAYLAPRSRTVKANWVEVFREFIEDMREEAGHAEGEKDTQEGS